MDRAGENSFTEVWRRGWDLNPRYPLRYVRFRGGSFQPLTHLSATTDVNREIQLWDNCGLTICDFERTFAELPRCDRPALRCEPQFCGSTADDSAPASPISR